MNINIAKESRLAAIARADAILARGPVVLVQEGPGFNRAERRHVAHCRATRCATCVRIRTAMQAARP